LKLGDPVEFEMTYDRRTGKPIASAVTKIGPEVVSADIHIIVYLEKWELDNMFCIGFE
jgi:hypothetical protein